MGFDWSWDWAVPHTLPDGQTTWDTYYSYWGKYHTDREGDNGYRSKNSRRNGEDTAKALQRRLNTWLSHWRLKGFTGVPANLVVDGIIGTKGDTAIRYAQLRFGVTRDGIVGSTTWNRLVANPPTA